MPPEASAAQQINFFQFILSAGGLPLVASGLVFCIWGVVNIVRVPKPGWILAQAWSCLPGVFAMIAIYSAYQSFATIATSPTQPKPTEIAAVVGAAFSHGFLGIACSLVPITLGLVAFGRYFAKNSAETNR